jgi:hypothetical protein
MRDVMESLGGDQQIVFATRGSVQRILSIGQLCRQTGCAHPQSIPEAFAWLQRQPRASRNRTFRCGRQKSKRERACTRSPEKLTDCS